MTGRLKICRDGKNCLVCTHNNWTSGMKRLRKLGFTIYSKDHVAYIGQMWTRGAILTIGSIECRHDKEEDRWTIEFELSYGNNQWTVEKREKTTACGVSDIDDRWNDFKRHFKEDHEAQIKIINNIFLTDYE